MPVVRDQHHGALKLVQRQNQRLAAVDVEVVGRLVEDDQVRPVERGKAEQQPRLFTAREILGRRFHPVRRQAEAGHAGAHLRFSRLRHQHAHMLDGAFVRAQLIQLMLGEEGDLQLGGAGHLAGQRCQTAGNQLGEGGLAVAVGAEQGDAVIGVDVERQA